MAQAYIYMECPVSGQTLTLGKLTIQSGVGTFQYSPDAVQENIWVPDPFRYPLSARSYSVTKNGGVPGFIDDAMPDGWGERLLHRVEKGPLDSIQILLKSPNGDRAGNIMAGATRVPQDGLGQTPPKALRINTLLVERFDRFFEERTGRFRRLPMLSGLTLLDAEWKARSHPDWQYAALADELYRRGAPDQDRRELYRRMAYNVLVGNADDHPRNHAVIWKDGTWRLSPMYDVLPILDQGPAQVLAMSVGIEGPRLNRGNLLSQHSHFALNKSQAEAVLDEVASWEAELHDYYSQFLAGAELDAAVTATSGARLKR
ncbi:hypothetical protein ALP50_01977 [Pseudomonas syringae pv. spinaceae]|uniref:Uncharacterized protein n=1 Tax=Pseudomonas syringae pv. spinaceae TaxID=264459 RepID=A0A0Q0ELT8_PSESX|nr:HipA domain-containing protein [Pseudomonas syringae]KPZ11947.1 Uncharacterized protein ALO94_02645 [Pseudomonas syringae pv. spinaceae]RMT25889.1 hypothetical protein ALP50_01977 [Pseudomonas syringae pv. spinaceae]